MLFRSIGGHGKRVVTIAAQFADIFQFTGLTHGAGGVPSAGGFGLEDVRERARWLTEAAAGRNVDIERSTLVQVTRVGGDVEAEFDQMVREFELPREVLEETPFVLIGSVEQVADKLERLREDLGISHVVVRDAEGFAPVVAALAGR